MNLKQIQPAYSGLDHQSVIQNISDNFNEIERILKEHIWSNSKTEVIETNAAIKRDVDMDGNNILNSPDITAIRNRLKAIEEVLGIA